LGKREGGGEKKKNIKRGKTARSVLSIYVKQEKGLASEI